VAQGVGSEFKPQYHEKKNEYGIFKLVEITIRRALRQRGAKWKR
jgi:hypothetical protein